MDLRSLLESSINKNKQNETKSVDSDKLFEEYYSKWTDDNKNEVKTKTEIPKFYNKMPSDTDQIGIKFREESRAIFLQLKTKDLADNDDIQNLYKILDINDALDEDKLINYEDFLKVGAEASDKLKEFFTPVIFCKLLHDDPSGQIVISNFFSYVMKKVWVHQTRIGLSLYDIYGYGYLQETHLETYIKDLMHELVQISNMEESFHSFYVCTVVRKFFFFLDPLHTNKIKIQDILASSFLDELLELRDPDLPKEHLQKNWFSSYSALKVYGIFLNLDKDRDGMLSKEELCKYGIGTLTETFISRVFQECVTYNGQIDFKTYLDLVLALENQKEPQALSYFFKLLDINKNSYLTRYELNYFFRAIQEQMQIHGQEPISFDNVCDEIFDMVRPINPYQITLKDLIDCGQGDVVISILIDLNGFWSYENREIFVGSDNDEDSNS